MNRENEIAMFAGKKKSGLTKEQLGLDSKKQSKINRDKWLIEIWKYDGFSGETITIVDNRTGIMKDYVLERKDKLPKNELGGIGNGFGFIHTDDYLKANGSKRMRQIEDILDNES